MWPHERILHDNFSKSQTKRGKRGSAPVADTPGKVQTGLLQVGLEAGLPGGAATLGANVRRSVFVDPLVRRRGARVRQHHGRRTLRARLKERESERASQSSLAGDARRLRRAHAHRGGSASDLLEVRDHLSLVGELRLALGTLEVVVLQPLALFAGQGHQSLGALGRAADRSRLRRRRARRLLHWAGVGGDGGGGRG